MDFCVRCYGRHTSQEYATVVPLEGEVFESFSLGYAHSGGGVTGEFTIDCTRLGGKKVFKIKCFSDAVDSLLGFSDILAQLSTFDESETLEDDIEEVLVKNNILNSLNKPVFMEFK